MKLRRASLVRRIFVPCLVLFVLSVAGLYGVQHVLYVRGFEETLDKIQESSLAVNRDAAQGVLASVEIAGARMLQTGEYEQFTKFAELQLRHANLTELSFVSSAGRVEHAAPAERRGRQVEPARWAQVKAARTPQAFEDAERYILYAPLHVTPDMVRLRPDAEPGACYGALCLEFPKQRINAMLAEARDTFQAGLRQALLLALAPVGAAIAIMALMLLFVIVRPLVRVLSGVITTLTQRAEQLVGISEQLSTASRQAADAAAQQAASLEETSSALEEMAATTRTNAEHSHKANGLAGEAQQAATGGNQTMDRLTQAMSAINEASGQIGRIIKTIEEIAFQTNLLALNAAVEAARAGEHGRGFAVVAEEVRSLARRAAQAAGQTTDLIGNTVQRVEEGTQISSQVGHALAEIVEKVTRASRLIQQVTDASREQAQGAEQINLSVSQMDRVTQQNAAGAEQSSAAAEELSREARGLQENVTTLAAVVGGAARRTAMAGTPPLLAATTPAPTVSRAGPPSPSRNAAPTAPAVAAVGTTTAGSEPHATAGSEPPATADF